MDASATVARVNSDQSGVVSRQKGTAAAKKGDTKGKKTGKKMQSTAGARKGARSAMYKASRKKEVQKEQMVGGLLGVACVAALVVGVIHKSFSNRNGDIQGAPPVKTSEYGSMTDRIPPLSPPKAWV